MAEKKSEDKPKAKVVKGHAGESGDPAVHQLIAERQTAVMNDDLDTIKAIDQQLADLGY